MPVDTSTIDRIVAGVLTQLGSVVARADGGSVTTQARRNGDKYQELREKSDPVASVQIADRIITADVLNAVQGTAVLVDVSTRAIVTPAALDVAKERGLTIRRSSKATPAGAGHSTPYTQHSALKPLLIVVHHTDPVARLWDDLKSSWRREFLGCPDDAAKLAIAELARAGVSQVVILADQTHRAACLANRHEKVKAVAIRDASDVAGIRTQLRANVWCLSPHGKTWFELRRLFSALIANS